MDNPYYLSGLVSFVSGLSTGFLCRAIIGAFTSFLGPRPSPL